MFSKIVKFTFFNANVIPVLDLHFKLNFNQFYESIRDLLIELQMQYSVEFLTQSRKSTFAIHNLSKE